MRAVLRLELIGDNYIQHKKLVDSGQAPQPHIKKLIRLWRYGRKSLRPWVARITGRDAHGYVREFVHSSRDYSEANSIGSKGIYEYYALKPGIYEFNECIALGQARRYFIRVERAKITEITREDVEAWLNDTLE